VIKCINFLGLCEEIVNVLLDVERVHEDEGRRSRFVKDFLFERVAVLSVVDTDFAVAGRDQPLIVWLQEGHIKPVHGDV
jgi:hypothetical protein